MCTHRLFLSSPGIILGVLNPLKADMSVLVRYLMTAIDCSPESLVVIIYTHSKEVVLIEDIRRRIEKDILVYLYHGINSSDGSGFNELKDKLRDACLNSSLSQTVARRVPASYNQLSSVIQEKRKLSMFSLTFNEIIEFEVHNHYT